MPPPFPTSSLPADNTVEEPPPVEAEDEEKEGEGCEEVEVDVVGVEPVPDLPFDERKVGAIMVECSRHVNLVRVPVEKSDPLLERVLGEVGHRQRELLSRLVRILEGDHLARLACANVSGMSPTPYKLSLLQRMMVCRSNRH